VSDWNAQKVIGALRFAAIAHEGQQVPGSTLPYLLHLSQVMTEVSAALQQEPARDGELSILCAVLHDCVEDTEVTLEQVAAEFGDAVAAGVSALTKNPSLPKADQMADSLCRIQDQPMAVWKVKLADRITNLQRPPAHWTRQKALRYQTQAGQILQALGDASPVLAKRLEAKIAAYGDLVPET